MANKKKNNNIIYTNGKSAVAASLIGKEYGNLRVLKYVGYSLTPSGWMRQMVEAVCSCGSVHTYCAYHIKNGVTKSCGCLQKELSIKMHTKHGQKSSMKYGNTGSILYSRWRAMFYRVKYNSIYTSKGIKICKRWQGKNGFVNFSKDMGEPPTQKHTLDRFPDQLGDYKPSNCRWATHVEQCNNFTRNVYITVFGERLTLANAKRKYSITRREAQRLSAIQNNKKYAHQ